MGSVEPPSGDAGPRTDQPRGQLQPAHQAQAVAALAGAQHLLDAAADAPHSGIVRFQPREHLWSAPGGGRGRGRHAAAGADRSLCLSTRKGAVGL